MAARTGFRLAAGHDGSSAVGARIARPFATRVQGTWMTALGVGRHAHMPPGPGAWTTGPVKAVPGFGRCVRRRCIRRAVRHGRPYRPPLRTHSRFPCRGGLYIRPDQVPIHGGVRRFLSGADCKKPPRKFENPSSEEKRHVLHAENAPPVLRRRVCCVANYRRFSSRIQAAQTFFPL